ncbi:conserved hypothetical protein [Sphingomonas gellani]|uniref:SnoaL-like domain-containing protein n=1 Tax=Sphingomonas gellani TaxID=1166340 RepID=A0A1H7YZR0_9SPHN|nr:SgcJ/EcaC family oxidoreductase [Sphingomonas gellani]SEM50818.1 conserved hypothetical protein [Sphingomonas gellani]
MMRAIGWLALSLMSLPGAVAAAPDPVAAVMRQSAAGWNAGDLDRFMTIYADDATFVVDKGLIRGKAAIAAHYRPSFVGKGAAGANKRGRLSFQFLGTRVIDARHRLLWARWTLTGDRIESGMTTLLFERRPAGWRIVSDHSS